MRASGAGGLYPKELCGLIVDYLPANLYHYLMGALVVGNIFLRFKTTTALANK
jgi:hypothetical protein